MENRGILLVFPVFHSAWMGKKISFPAADDLFRGSLRKSQSISSRRNAAIVKRVGISDPFGFYVNSWGRAKIEKLEIVSECESSGTIFMYYRTEFFS